MDIPDLKPLIWIASSKRDLKEFPEHAQDLFGQALYDAQCGDLHPDAKPLKGFGDASVVEIVLNDFEGAFRTVYTVKFAGIVYVLHAFQKKSKEKAKTPKYEIDKITTRLAIAKSHYEEQRELQKRKDEKKA